jgi:tripartite-type tricarboxylate transporter receptor subunit TctC
MKAGRLRAIAVTSLKRLPSVPDLPTVAESGYPDFESGVWFGVLAPARTPQEIISRLNSELVNIARRPEFMQRLVAEGSEVVGNSPEQFGAYIKIEIARWSKAIKEKNIKAD